MYNNQAGQHPQRPTTMLPGKAAPGPASAAPDMPPTPGYAPGQQPQCNSRGPSFAAPLSSSMSSRLGSLKPSSSSTCGKLFNSTISTAHKLSGNIPILHQTLNSIHSKIQVQGQGVPPQQQQLHPSPPSNPGYTSPYYTGQYPAPSPSLPPRPQQPSTPFPGYNPASPPPLPPRLSPHNQHIPFPHPPQTQGVSSVLSSPPSSQHPQPVITSYHSPQPQYTTSSPSPSSTAPGTPYQAPVQQQPLSPPPQQQSSPQTDPTSTFVPPQPEYAVPVPTDFTPNPGPLSPPPQSVPFSGPTGYVSAHPQYMSLPSSAMASPVPDLQPGYVPPQPQYVSVPTSTSTIASPSVASNVPSAFPSPPTGHYQQSHQYSPQQPQYANITSPVAGVPTNNVLSPVGGTPPPPAYSPFALSQPPTHVQELSSEPLPEKPPPKQSQPLAQPTAPAHMATFVAELDAATASSKPTDPPDFCMELPGESATLKPKPPPSPNRPQPGPPPGIPRNLPTLRYDGPANSILAVCRPGRIDNFTTWYLANSAPGFTVCSRCYTDHIARSRHTGLFDGFTGSCSPDGSFVPGHLCNFSSPTVQNHLWPKVLETHNTAPLASFMARRSNVRNCRDKLDRRGNRWFIPVSSMQKPDFVICEGCFLDHLTAGPFASQFAPLDEDMQTPKNENMHCIFRLSDFIPRILAFNEKDNNWSQVLEAIKITRMPLPKCTGQLAQSPEWFTTKAPIPGFVMCRTCWVDHIACSKFEKEMVPLSADPKQQRVCSLMNTHGASLVLAIQAAIEFFNWSLFWDVASECAKLHPCGSPQSLFLTLPGSGTPGKPFTVCDLHANAYLAPYNMLTHLVSTSLPSASTQQACALSPIAQHTVLYLSAAQTSADLGLVSPFNTMAAKLALLPPCPKNVPIKNALWYGWPDDSPICPSCYEAVAVGAALTGIGHLPTPLAKTIATPTSCVLYSARMRALFASMARKGDADGFREQVKKRAVAWTELQAARQKKTLPSMDVEQMLQSMNIGTKREVVTAVRGVSHEPLPRSMDSNARASEFLENTRSLKELEKIWEDLE